MTLFAVLLLHVINSDCVLDLNFSGEYSEREGYNGSEFAPTYEDKDGDWMLVGDVPWE